MIPKPEFAQSRVGKDKGFIEGVGEVDREAYYQWRDEQDAKWKRYRRMKETVDSYCRYLDLHNSLTLEERRIVDAEIHERLLGTDDPDSPV